jgi:hypothetical protein
MIMSDTLAAIQTLVRNGEIRISEKMMRKRIHSKLIHEGQYVAEVDVELIETDESWSDLTFSCTFLRDV